MYSAAMATYTFLCNNTKTSINLAFFDNVALHATRRIKDEQSITGSGMYPRR